MTRRTLGDVRAELARIAGAVGMQASDARVLNLLNLATEELVNEGDWPSLVDRYIFKQYGGTITLPSGYERILHMKVDGAAAQMQSSWFEFIGYGPISNDSTCSSISGVLDRDDVLLYSDIPDPSLGTEYTVRLETVVDERTGADLPDNVIVHGLDEDANAIRTGSGNVYIDGVSFQWVNGSGNLQYAESSQVYSSITGAIKPETKMPVNVFIVPVGGGTAIQVGQWGARDTNPRYRRYKINGLSTATEYTMACRLRRGYQPVAVDNDRLLISNMPALRAMMLAVYYFEIGKLDLYANNKVVALDILRKEARTYRGEVRKKPLITMSENSTDSCGTYVS